MRLVASGTVFDTRHAPANERSASGLSALSAADGTIFVSFRHVFVVFYAGEGVTRSARWARVAMEEG
jgi:hypothetical protein